MPPMGTQFCDAVRDCITIAREHEKCLLIFNGIPVVIQPETTVAEADFIWHGTIKLINDAKRVVRPAT